MPSPFSFMDMFRPGNNSSQQQSAGQPQQQPPASSGKQSQLDPASNNGSNMTTKTSDGTASNGVVPADGTNAAPNESPIDKFKDLWNNETNDTSSTPDGMFNIDMTKLQESAKKVDFTKAINPEIFKKIAAGGEEATQAYQQAMNELAQNLYAQSAVTTTKIVEQAIKKAEEQFGSRVPNMIKKQQAKESFFAENKALSHPSAAPLIEAMQTQMQAKFPNASSKELNEMTKEYLVSVFSNLNPSNTTDSASTNSSSSGDIDWEKEFLG